MLGMRTKTVVMASSTALAALLSGCAGAHSGQLAYSTAPGLHEDAPLSSRGGANPNAPYAMVDHTAHLVTRPTQVDINAAAPCAASDLSLFESGAHVDGDRRSVRLNLVNHAKEACQLSGYPAISLLRADGSLLGSLRIEKVTATTLEAAVSAPLSDASRNSASAKLTSAPSVAVLLLPAGEAAFEVGWTSGPNCDQVGSIAVAAPGTVQTFVVRHTLTVCESRIRITAMSGNTDL